MQIIKPSPYLLIGKELKKTTLTESIITKPEQHNDQKPDKPKSPKEPNSGTPEIRSSNANKSKNSRRLIKLGVLFVITGAVLFVITRAVITGTGILIIKIPSKRTTSRESHKQEYQNAEDSKLKPTTSIEWHKQEDQHIEDLKIFKQKLQKSINDLTELSADINDLKKLASGLIDDLNDDLDDNLSHNNKLFHKLFSIMISEQTKQEICKFSEQSAQTLQVAIQNAQNLQSSTDPTKEQLCMANDEAQILIKNLRQQGEDLMSKGLRISEDPHKAKDIIGRIKTMIQSPLICEIDTHLSRLMSMGALVPKSNTKIKHTIQGWLEFLNDTIFKNRTTALEFYNRNTKIDLIQTNYTIERIEKHVTEVLTIKNSLKSALNLYESQLEFITTLIHNSKTNIPEYTQIVDKLQPNNMLLIGLIAKELIFILGTNYKNNGHSNMWFGRT